MVNVNRLNAYIFYLQNAYFLFFWLNLQPNEDPLKNLHHCLNLKFNVLEKYAEFLLVIIPNSVNIQDLFIHGDDKYKSRRKLKRAMHNEKTIKNLYL